ncbi:MAG TPA: hypothetical protein VIS53_02180 [Candidatus Udaeobacter sp.]
MNGVPASRNFPAGFQKPANVDLPYHIARAVLGHSGWFDITDVVSLAAFLNLAPWII